MFLEENNTHQIISKPPTYLKQFFIEDEEINLVYKRLESVSVEGEEEVIPVIEKLETTENDMEITGNPLQVDLDGDDSLVPIVKTQMGNNWTSQEAKMLPINNKEARTVIDEFLIKQKQTIPIYCICDGMDAGRTVILGAQHSHNGKMSCSVEILDGFDKNDMSMNFSLMKQEHLKNTKVQTKIDYLVKRKYYLHGYNLQGIESENCHLNGCMAMEVISNNLNQMPTTQNMNIMLQVIVGHEKSPVHFLWQKLTKLQRYYNILNLPKSSIKESTVINKESDSEDDICKGISYLINSLGYLQKKEELVFDLNNLRYHDFLDNVWDLLKNCEDLSTLRDCFYHFFGELARSLSESETNVEINPSDKSNISRIVKDILDIKITVPTLTFVQCLELLFELGLENLKNDYLAIFRHFYSASQDNILKYWNKFCNATLTDRELGRKTRATIMQKDAMTNSESNEFKLGYLAQMHTAVEFLYMVSNKVFLPEECSLAIIEKVYNEYVDTTYVNTEYSGIKKWKLEQFSTDIRSTNMVNNRPLDSCTVQMKSYVNKTEITTAFNLSIAPIFPTSVFCDYDDNQKLEENFYVTKFVKVARLNQYSNAKSMNTSIFKM